MFYDYKRFHTKTENKNAQKMIGFFLPISQLGPLPEHGWPSPHVPRVPAYVCNSFLSLILYSRINNDDYQGNL